jgi:tripartite ATP-independent transporter DctM subunit
MSVKTKDAHSLQRGGELDRFDRALAIILAAAAAAFLAGCCTIVLVSVFFRYVLSDALVWGEEVARWFLMGTAFFGAALAYRRGQHIGLPYLIRRMSDRQAALARCAIALLIAVFAAFLFYTEAFEFYPLRATITLPASGLSQGLFSLPVMAATIIIALSALKDSFRVGWRDWILIALGLAAAVAIFVSAGQALVAHALANPLAIAWGLFVLLVVLGLPTAFAMGTAGLSYLVLAPGLPLFPLAQQVESGVNSVALLSIPLFILTGKLQENTSISDRLLDFIRIFLGRLRGGMGLVTIGGIFLFSGISGSPTADLSAIGSVMIPALRRQGFSSGEAVGLISASTIMGHTIPPSIAIIVLAQITGLSITMLFIGGVIPATFLAIVLAAFVLLRARRLNLAPNPALAPKERVRYFWSGLPSLSVPFVLFGGIFSGVVTPTEVGALAVLLSIILGVIYRELSWRTLARSFVEAASLTGMAMLLLATANALAFASVDQELPRRLTHLVEAIAAGPTQFILLSLPLLIAVGSVLEFPALLIFGPLLIPVAATLGLDSIHYAIFLINALLIGSFLPPIGVLFYVTCGIAGTSVEGAMKHSFIYLAIIAAGMLLIGFVPALVLWLPSVMGLTH